MNAYHREFRRLLDERGLMQAIKIFDRLPQAGREELGRELARAKKDARRRVK